jgi:hypothetical protein
MRIYVHVHVEIPEHNHDRFMQACHDIGHAGVTIGWALPGSVVIVESDSEYTANMAATDIDVMWSTGAFDCFREADIIITQPLSGIPGNRPTRLSGMMIDVWRKWHRTTYYGGTDHMSGEMGRNPGATVISINADGRITSREEHRA